MEAIKRVISYKELLKNNVKKDIRGKYKGSALGVLWSFVNPLLMVAVYAFVFGYIFPTRGNGEFQNSSYTAYIITGVIPWNFFVGSVNQGSGSVVANSNLLKKVFFPREILPLSAVFSNFVTFLISMIIVLVALVVTGTGFSIYILLLPIIMIIQFVFVLGLVLILSSINVYVRDVEYIVGVLIMILFYATPIIYTMSMVEDKAFAFIYGLNPITIIANGYRDVLFYQQMPNFIYLAGAMIFSVILLFAGYKIFRKLEIGFAEEL